MGYMKKEDNIQTNAGFGVAGFVLSLLGVFILILGIYIGTLLASIIGGSFSLLGLILCIVQFKKGKTGLATAGLILNILVIIIATFNIVSFLILRNAVESYVQGGSNGVEDFADAISGGG
tara:strand:- start:4906 stop:5265 length:360 start_codon:yes stop_codon:yes gene_type:complete